MEGETESMKFKKVIRKIVDKYKNKIEEIENLAVVAEEIKEQIMINIEPYEQEKIDKEQKRYMEYISSKLDIIEYEIALSCSSGNSEMYTLIPIFKSSYMDINSSRKLYSRVIHKNIVESLIDKGYEVNTYPHIDKYNNEYVKLIIRLGNKNI